jgi:hypothetical protein
MVTLTRTLGQYLKNKGQPIATPMLGEIKARRREGFHNRLQALLGKCLSSWASGHSLVSQTLNNWSSDTPMFLRLERKSA